MARSTDRNYPWDQMSLIPPPMLTLIHHVHLDGPNGTLAYGYRLQETVSDTLIALTSSSTTLDGPGVDVVSKDFYDLLNGAWERLSPF